MSKKHRERRKEGASRSVLYGFHVPDEKGYSVQSVFDESAMEKLLASAEAHGVIHQFETGRGAIVWFYGTPGQALRDLRDDVLSMMPTEAVPLNTPETEAEWERLRAKHRDPPSLEALKILAKK